jgi:hypothetical protein
MISGKGILYTVLAAAGTAAVVGTMLTGGTRREKLQRLGSKVQDIGSKVQNFVGSLKNEGLSRTSTSRSQISEPGSMGHA